MQTDTEENDDNDSEVLLANKKPSFSQIHFGHLISNMKTHIWSFILVLCMLVVFINLVIGIFKWDPQPWFENALKPLLEVATWNNSYLDSHLHELSRWEGLSAATWQSIVNRTYAPLHIPPNASFTYMEVGIGVGAWSRIFLKHFPGATLYGIDVQQQALQIADLVLPADRVTLQRLHMFDIPQQLVNKRFDYIIFPGVLCYAQGIAEIFWIIQGIAFNNVIKVAGRIAITFVPQYINDMGTCVTTVHPQFWLHLDYFRLIHSETTDHWGVLHMKGRYAVFLERTR